eukprot:7312827-Pyramimonas_sp.AAC.1
MSSTPDHAWSAPCVDHYLEPARRHANSQTPVLKLAQRNGLAVLGPVNHPHPRVHTIRPISFTSCRL